MKDQPTALRLADALEGDAVSPIDLKAAAELRRLAAVEAQRDALLEALKHVRAVLPHERWADDTKKMVDTAIKAVEQGEKD